MEYMFWFRLDDAACGAINYVSAHRRAILRRLPAKGIRISIDKPRCICSDETPSQAQRREALELARERAYNEFEKEGVTADEVRVGDNIIYYSYCRKVG